MASISGPSDIWDCNSNSFLVKRRLSTPAGYEKKTYQEVYNSLSTAIKEKNESEIRTMRGRLWVIAEGLAPQERLTEDEIKHFITIRILADHILSEIKAQPLKR